MMALDDYLLMAILTITAQLVSSLAVQLRKSRKPLIRHLRHLFDPPMMTMTMIWVTIARQYLQLPSSENLPYD
jgi:hypothetical protein